MKKKQKELIMFEQQGNHILEGELFCEICGFKGKSDLNIALAHKNGFHLVGSKNKYK